MRRWCQESSNGCGNGLRCLSLNARTIRSVMWVTIAEAGMVLLLALSTAKLRRALGYSVVGQTVETKIATLDYFKALLVVGNNVTIVSSVRPFAKHTLMVSLALSVTLAWLLIKLVL